MTTITANNFDINVTSKRDIYEKFTSLCRIPVNYVEFLYSQDILYIPIFYRLGLEKDPNKKDIFLEQMQYIDGLVMIGGTVYNHFPTNYEKQKTVDR